MRLRSAPSFFVFVSLAMGVPAQAEPLLGDGPGCTDKVAATRLAELQGKDFDPEYIEIWAKGMQDGSCRGYSAGQDVSVEERSDGLACVKAADDTQCFWMPDAKAPL